MPEKRSGSIILLSNAYYPNIGGIENSLYHLAKSYQKDGYHVDILVGDINLVNDRSLPSFEVLDGINVHRFGVRQPWCQFPVLRSFARYIDMKKKLKSLIHCDTLGIVSRYHDTTVVAKIVCRLPVVYLVPGVVQEQDKPINTSIDRGYFSYIKKLGRLYVHSMVQQLAFRITNHLIVFSENMKKQVEQCFNRKKPLIEITKPGVDCDRFFPIEEHAKVCLKQTLNIPESGPILLGVGRLVTAKGFHHLIAALPYCPQATAVIIGDGPERKSLECLAVQLGVSGRVIFKGAVAEPNLYYQAADVFMMTSLYEPLGQIILEAIASGLPVIAFSKSAAPHTATDELLSPKNGVFVDRLDGLSLSKAINSVLDNPTITERLSKQGRTLAVDSFNWGALAKMLLTKMDKARINS
ncbi:glycosyltransferase family 4 protein [Pseudoalteromonas aurantia]|uniref:Glycosyltransferase n=1 Tax=Pseudoalteromonas aurantia 208 TaxID=1314867 RepID=A0ABR9EE80_9GAMM|nr:glycosyltransferase family 4 protein [Pseudoalteromonas aurantia]MBE0369284.1 hypothetical protein [Pseudoalteromonas aurantia 208]